MNDYLQKIQKLELSSYTGVQTLLDTLEEIEMNFEVVVDNKNLQIELSNLQIISYLIFNDFINARFYWKRLQKDCKNDNSLINLFEVVKKMWFKEYDQVILALDNYISLQKSFKYPTILTLLKQHVNQFLIQIVQTNFKNIETSYLAKLFNLNQNNIEDIVNQQNWKINGNYVEIQSLPLQDQQQENLVNQQIDQITNLVQFIQNYD